MWLTVAEGYEVNFCQSEVAVLPFNLFSSVEIEWMYLYTVNCILICEFKKWKEENINSQWTLGRSGLFSLQNEFI